MKIIFLYVTVLVLSMSTLSSQSPDEIVTKVLTASGGTSKLHEIKSMITENTIKVQGLEIENLTTVLVGKAMRSDSKIMGNNMVQAFDGTTPWSITPILMGGNGEPQVLSEEMAKSVISQIDPFPLLDYIKKGTRLELLATEKVKDKDAYHLKIYPKNGAESEIWVDVTTGLLSKLKTTQNMQETEVFFLKYTEIEGINFATDMETLNPAAGIISINTKIVKLNTTIDETIFQMPVTKK
ncbi:MAG: outer membrane lipoprotein-sorting protein [Saprospiraceae bacterium]